MRRQRTKQCEAWRRRREQYLRESGRHVELIKEGYASADSTNSDRRRARAVLWIGIERQDCSW